MNLKLRVRQTYQRLRGGMNGFKKDYWPRTNIVNDEKGNLVTDCHSIWLQTATIFGYRLPQYLVTDCHSIWLQTATVFGYRLSQYLVTDCHNIWLQTATIFGYRLPQYLVTDCHIIWLQTATVFWLRGGTISLSS
jgi:hypothetical protein